jgi:hypothetical protein
VKKYIVSLSFCFFVGEKKGNGVERKKCDFGGLWEAERGD